MRRYLPSPKVLPYKTLIVCRIRIETLQRRNSADIAFTDQHEHHQEWQIKIVSHITGCN